MTKVPLFLIYEALCLLKGERQTERETQCYIKDTIKSNCQIMKRYQFKVPPRNFYHIPPDTWIKIKIRE